MMRGGMGLGVVARNVRRVDSSAVLPSSSSFVRLTADCLHNTNGQSISTRSAKAMIAYSTVAQPSQDPSSGRLFSTSAPTEASISRFHSPSTPAPSSSLVESQRSTTAELMNEFINVTELDEAKQSPSPSNYNVQSGSVASIDSSIAPVGPFSGVKGEPFFANQAYLDWPFPSQEHGNASLRMAGFMEGYDAEHHHSTSGYATSHHNAFVLDHPRIPQRSNDCASEPRGSAMQGSQSTLHVANSLSSRTAYSNPNVRAPDVGRRLFDLSSRFPSTPAQPDSRRQYSYSYSPSSSPITSPITAFSHRPNWFDGRSVSSLSRGVRPTINTYNLPSHYGLPSAAHYMSSSATTGQDGDPSPSSAGVGDETIDNTTAPEKKRKRSSEKDEAKPKECR
ncbi:hypothetical protein FRC02_012013 [Tulasnella sp. 418]|nr:hypothetical protein FRC02_012013 [Tulasnella sp. 418]